jgi:hypothetical protein
VQQPVGRDEKRLKLEALERESAQLREALASRIVLEQAKGALAERYRLTIDDAFLLLRSSARSARINIHGLAEEVVATRESPQALIRALARDKRLRAIAHRERADATAQRNGQVQTRQLEQLDRLADTRPAQRPIARIRADSRSDAVDLASRLGGYRWYLIVPDEEHWDVVVEFTGEPDELPADLCSRIDGWLRARALRVARIRIGDREMKLAAS